MAREETYTIYNMAASARRECAGGVPFSRGGGGLFPLPLWMKGKHFLSLPSQNKSLMVKVSDRERSIYRVTALGSVVNFVLLLFKFAAGILGNSAAMIADAVHSLSDFLTDLVVMLFVRISSKPEDGRREYGYGKYETLATLIIGVVLLAVGLGIFYNGMSSIVAVCRGERLQSPGVVALVAAAVSIGSKEWLYRYTVRCGRRLDSQAVIANAWHHRSDALSSIGTLVGIGGALLIGDKWAVLDPVAAVAVSVFVVKAAFKLIVPSVNELVDTALPAEVEDEIVRLAASVPGVVEPHNLHTRRVGSTYVMEMHILVDGDMPLRDAHAIATRVEDLLIGKFGKGTHVTVHVEPYGENA